MKNYHKEYAQLVHSLCIVSWNQNKRRISFVFMSNLGRKTTKSLLRNHSNSNRRFVWTLFSRGTTKFNRRSFTKRFSLCDAQRSRRFSFSNNQSCWSVTLFTTTRSIRCSKSFVDLLSFNKSIRFNRIKTWISTFVFLFETSFYIFHAFQSIELDLFIVICRCFLHSVCVCCLISIFIILELISFFFK